MSFFIEQQKMNPGTSESFTYPTGASQNALHYAVLIDVNNRV